MLELPGACILPNVGSHFLLPCSIEGAGEGVQVRRAPACRGPGKPFPRANPSARLPFPPDKLHLLLKN